MPKASAPEFHQSNGSTARAEPCRRSGNHTGSAHCRAPADCFGANPSPRLWATPPGATPAKLCEHTTRIQNRILKTGTFYLAGIRNFLLGSDIQEDPSVAVLLSRDRTDRKCAVNLAVPKDCLLRTASA